MFNDYQLVNNEQCVGMDVKLIGCRRIYGNFTALA
jgi:hypothetical protein